MALDAELLEILACPNCKTPVVLVHNGAGLKCNTCHRVYPIKDDIPVMLIDEATVEKIRMNILLVRLRLIGDVVFTTPADQSSPPTLSRTPASPISSKRKPLPSSATIPTSTK